MSGALSRGSGVTVTVIGRGDLPGRGDLLRRGDFPCAWSSSSGAAIFFGRGGFLQRQAGIQWHSFAI